MSLETFGFISDLVATNPTGGDPRSQGDDHLRGIKATLQATFPHADSAINIKPDAMSMTIGVGTEDALKIDAATRTIKALAPYLLNADNGVPVGTIIDFAGVDPPTGYLACPLVGTNVSRATYAALFAAIGTTWGSGDDSTTFGLPYFPADYAALQANGNVAAVTTGDIKSHNHGNVTSDLNATAGTQTYSPGLSTNVLTGSTGGPANLAAGIRVRKCVKY
jgi:microcystin-dependent protein